MAEKLAAEVSRVSVSIDSMDEKIHDEIRGGKIMETAIEGLEHARKAGMDPYLNITVGHYNANTDHSNNYWIIQKIKNTRLFLT